LDSLERRWRRRLEMQQRDSAKKAAAATASARGQHGFQDAGAQNPNVVTQTASWLDRASNILKETGCPQQPKQQGTTAVLLHSSKQKFSLTQEQAQALQSLPKTEIEKQMKEVERLIHEGPLVQQTTAGLSLTLHDDDIKQDSSSDGSSDGQRTPPEPADKRMKTGAEDAEALVGFLTAVRASAAAATTCSTDSLSA